VGFFLAFKRGFKPDTTKRAKRHVRAVFHVRAVSQPRTDEPDALAATTALVLDRSFALLLMAPYAGPDDAQNYMRGIGIL